MKDEMLFAEFVSSLDCEELSELSEFFETADDIEKKAYDEKVQKAEGGLDDECD